MPSTENWTAIMFFYVYVLQNREGGLYIGFTSDLKKRVKEHNRKLNFSTKAYIPWRLIHYEAYSNQRDAMRREKYLKSTKGSRTLKLMLRDFFWSKNKSNF